MEVSNVRTTLCWGQVLARVCREHRCTPAQRVLEWPVVWGRPCLRSVRADQEEMEPTEGELRHFSPETQPVSELDCQS